jgi:hypothetical protein
VQGSAAKVAHLAAAGEGLVNRLVLASRVHEQVGELNTERGATDPCGTPEQRSHPVAHRNAGNGVKGFTLSGIS